jgi:membrane protease YdiL (CAAX protease family)
MDQTPALVPSPHPQPAAHVPALRRIFFNQVELRAGWRLLIFLAVLMASPDRTFLFNLVGPRASHNTNSPIPAEIETPPEGNQTDELDPWTFINSDGFGFIVLVLVTAVMAVIETREPGYYGLPVNAAFRGNFWLGCLWGFGAISVLLLSLRADHNFAYGLAALHGWSVVRSAFLWAVAFLLVGLFEEFLLRGYAQFTLTVGIGFWPAALLSSLVFASLHRNNPGESVFGLCQIVLIGLFLCFTLWRTGTLWFAVGFHAAWDWAQSFFYGTPDSGVLAQDHLLHSAFTGPDWLTGGTVGPEGSVLLTPLLLLLCVAFYLAFPNRAPYPDPEAIHPAQTPHLPQTTLGI